MRAITMLQSLGMPWQRVAFLIVSLLILGVTAAYLYDQSLYLTMTVVVDGEEYSERTKTRSVAALLEEIGIELDQQDLCQPSPDSSFDKAFTISITRAVPVTIDVDGDILRVKSAAVSVAKLLEQQGIVVAADDHITPALDSPLEADLSVEIMRLQRYSLTLQYALPYSRIVEETSEMGEGFEQQIQVGQEGLQEDVLEVVAVSGVEVERVWLKTEMIRPIIHEVVRIGTAGVAEYDEDTFPYLKKHIMETTGYCSCYACCGKHPWDQAYGITISGLNAGRGVVGADLNLFPLHTKLYVEGYGYCVVGDTGSGVMGRMRIDLGFATHEEAAAWALRRSTAVYILEQP